MNNLITKDDLIENNAFFWAYYFSLFKGFDETKELNIDEVLEEVLKTDSNELYQWAKEFFQTGDKENPKFIGGQLNQTLCFQIDFLENEIVFFINDIYIGNLGGHFEAWSLTLGEITSFEKFDFIFLLLLPMVGISKTDFSITQNLITKHLKSIPKFVEESDYIAKCITNGLVMDGEFYKDENIGIVNNQNHSIRNINKYPDNRDDIIQLNKSLK